MTTSSDRLDSLLPRPRSLTPLPETCRLGAAPAIAYAGKDTPSAAHRLADLLHEEWNLPRSLSRVSPDRPPALALAATPAEAERLASRPPTAPALAGEAYRLEVTAGGARVEAGSAQGLLWGAMTLRQLVFHDGQALCIPGVRIADQPHYPWRGFMIDSGRAPNSILKLKRIIRLGSAFKLNFMVFREGDDELNAVRYTSNKLGSHDPQALGMDDIAELAHYAARHGIALIPEIESLGHSAAKGRHYPHLVEGGLQTAYEGIGIHTRKSHLLPADPRSLALLKTLYTEWLHAVNPPFIHLGLDEVRLPADTQAAHLAQVLPLLAGCARTQEVDTEAVVWSDAPDTPEAFRDKVIRCLWKYADARTVDLDNPDLAKQGFRALSEPGCRERVFMAGGSASGHTANSKSPARAAFQNLAEWAQWGASRPNFTGLLAVQWGGNQIDDWLPDFLAAADFGWTPPDSPPDLNALTRRIQDHLARLRDFTAPPPHELDRPAWDGIWLKNDAWAEEVQPIATAPKTP